MHLRAYTAIIGGQGSSEDREKGEQGKVDERRRAKGVGVGEEAKSQKTEGKTEGHREHEERSKRKRERESGNGEGCAAARERMDSASRDVLLTVMSLSSPKVPRRHCINLLLPTPPY